MRGLSTVVLFYLLTPFILTAQQEPSYSFISFDKSYKNLKSGAEKDGYNLKEEDINSPYGKKLLKIEKKLDFYTEKIYMFFNENDELIYFSVIYALNENQSRRVLENLYTSIIKKLTEKYGENDNAALPYYKKVGDRYLVFLHPFYSYSNNVEVSFKDETRYNAYADYYDKEIKKLEIQSVEDTLKKF